jgi:hypothetical protein
MIIAGLSKALGLGWKGCLREYPLLILVSYPVKYGTAKPLREYPQTLLR